MVALDCAFRCGSVLAMRGDASPGQSPFYFAELLNNASRAFKTKYCLRGGNPGKSGDRRDVFRYFPQGAVSRTAARAIRCFLSSIHENEGERPVCPQVSVGEVAKLAAEGNAEARTAIKIIKDAARLAQK
jgi:hypothetical protein